MALLESNVWLQTVLEAVRAAAPPQAWIGAGVIRDVVWDAQYGAGFAATNVKDIDVVYFDAADATGGGEGGLQGRLETLLPGPIWEVTNQARVHEWFEGYFGLAVAPLASIEEAVATWPEFATSVAVRLTDAGSMDVIAPLGLDDLLDGIWRRNPSRVTLAEARRRLARKNVARRWPGVQVV